jgi:hypothetical protein
MIQYKRNQVEEAISRVTENKAKPSSELRTRIKRLLDADRTLGRKPRSNDPEQANYAFYSSDAPGRGFEVQFSEYDAFALSVGLRLLQHGWPQGFAISTLRRARPELELHHARTLKQDPKTLFDLQKLTENARPGDVFVDNTDPVFLTIVSGQNPPTPKPMIFRGMRAAFEYMRKEQPQSYSFHELVTSAHNLHHELSKAPLRKRGRGN